jgi:hypothetical protein
MTVFLQNMKYWEVVLREVFLAPPAMLAEAGIPMPLTIDDLAKCSGLTTDEVSRHLQRVDTLQASPVDVDMTDLDGLRKECHAAGRNLILLDVRTPREFSEGHLTGAVSLHNIDFPRMLPAMADACVITIGRDNSQAWSAAMYLRDHGVPAARSLSC